MTLAFEFEDVRVVYESIDDSACGHVVGKDLRPVGKGQIHRDADAAASAALQDHLKE
jgi:hypothetical protein